MDGHNDSKIKVLAEHGAFNPRARRVRDPLFQHSEFFDPRDMVLVKYEMLRRVRIEGQSVTQAARAFGFSRVAFYQARAAFRDQGLPGLLPKRRGPRRAHKLTEAVLSFIDQKRAAEGNLRTPALAKMIRQQLSLSIHPRSIERALTRRAKKGRQTELS